MNDVLLLYIFLDFSFYCKERKAGVHLENGPFVETTRSYRHNEITRLSSPRNNERALRDSACKLNGEVIEETERYSFRETRGTLHIENKY